MFLTEANVLQYLLERRFADLESVVAGAYRVRNLSSRNRNFRVTCGAREYLVKQPGSWDAHSRRTLEQEAAIYWQAKSSPASQPLRSLVPESYGYDPSHSILILEYLAEQRSLRAGNRFAPQLARLAGATMAAFHRDMRGVSDRALFPLRKPWYLSINQADTGKADDRSEGQNEMLRLVQKYSDFARALEALTSEWREDTAVHGDWKLDNCLLSTEGDRIRVIDWEFANWGDPFEDIGTMLQSYWGFWVRGPSQYPIETIRPALRAFLHGYAGEEKGDAAGMAARALRFAGARMLQTAYEAVYGLDRLNGETLCLLQASLNILSRPEWALAEIFGADWNGLAD